MSCCWERDNGFCPSSRRPCLQADWPNCKGWEVMEGGREGWETLTDHHQIPDGQEKPMLKCAGVVF